ncbi:MAG: hypothetical protein AAFY88_05630 [Acidobacteriota bacterium]
MAFGLFGTTVTVRGMLEAMRETLKERRRASDGGLLKAHRFKAPKWVAGDDLEACYDPEHQERLAKSGVLVWAHVVAAHEKLSKRGLRDHPATVVYSPHFDGDVIRAAEVSEALFTDKGQTLEAPHNREFNQRVPAEIAGEQVIFFTTLAVHRGQLPGRMLKGSFFPLLVQPQDTPATMVLSKRYWPPALQRYWAA